MNKNGKYAGKPTGLVLIAKCCNCLFSGKIIELEKPRKRPGEFFYKCTRCKAIYPEEELTTDAKNVIKQSREGIYSTRYRRPRKRRKK